jgi:hypothetical protein
MSIRDFYNDLKKHNKKEELNQMYQKPVSEKRGQMPVAQVFEKNVYYQADIMYMPEDKGYKYILVCIDMYDGSVDAEPLKTKDNETVIKGFRKMFSRKYLDYPFMITLDQGSEFKSSTKNYFNKNGTNVKYALTNRHRQVANVERANQKIASILFKRMTSQELLTGEQSKEWVDDLPELIEILNENKKKPLKKEISDLPIVDEYSGNLLTIGKKVRLQLDYPISNTDNKRLHGKFRSTDIRWTPNIYKITEVLIKPGFPPMYLTEDDKGVCDNVARTKNQLQVVSKNIIEPKKDYIRGNPEHYIVSKILDKKIENRKTFYKIKWKGFNEDEATWEPVSILNRTKELKELKRKFDENN